MKVFLDPNKGSLWDRIWALVSWFRLVWFPREFWLLRFESSVRWNSRFISINIYFMAKGGKSFQDTEGRPQRSRPMNESDEDSNCFTDAEDEAWHSPCNSSFTCSASDMLRFSCASHCEIDGSPEACSKSYVSDRSLQGDLESGIWEIKKGDNDCRICHLNLEEAAPESGVQILLGCSCKNDLAIAHKLCAEKWFKIKGNK